MLDSMEDSRRPPPKIPVQQILILAICRVAEPLALTSVFPYLPEMIESLDVPKNDVAKWAGITSAAFSLSQVTTGVLWGRASDKWGRKPAILTGVILAMASSLLFGFARTLAWAIVARAFAGAVNGDVGIFRTVVAEMIPQKELQPRAFSFMPMVYTMGSIFGPSIGGALANPAVRYPGIFGKSAFFKRYPYALPNMAASLFFMVGLMTGFLFLKETLEDKKYKRDYGRAMGQTLVRAFGRAKSKLVRAPDNETTPLLKDPPTPASIAQGELTPQIYPESKHPPHPTYREIFNRQTNINLLSYSFLALHSVGSDQLLPIFLHYPQQRDRASDPNVQLPFKFAGGFGINADRIGLIFTLYGICGIFIQFFIFPYVARRFGVLSCLKFTSILFPIVYLITPFTALLPTPATQQTAIFLILVIRICGVIFAFPCSGILLTNSAVSLSVLGMLNGVATSTCALGRAIGPIIGGWTFSYGMNKGYVILPWWTLAAAAALGGIPSWYLVEMEAFAGDGDAKSENNNPETSKPRVDDFSNEERSQAIATRRVNDSNPNGSALNENGVLLAPGSINNEEAPLIMNLSSSLEAQRIWSTGSETT